MIIGFLGKKRCGKDTAAEYLIENHNFIRYAFGDPVKDVAKAMFGFTDEQLYGDKKEIIDPEWNISPRQAFQSIGTDYAQYSIYRSLPELETKVPIKCFWIHKFKHWYNKQKKLNPNIKVVISDLRFIHEVNCLKELGSIIIKINRNTSHQDNHISENEINIIDKDSIDFTIYNNTDINQYYEKLESILKQLK